MRALAPVIATVLAVGCVIISAPTSAAAATDTLMVSADGTTFAPTLASSLFDPADRLVPGQSITATLWVTNAAPTAAAMRVGVEDVHFSSAAFADNVTMSVSDADTGVGREALISDFADCQTIVASHLVDAGATERLLVVLTMDDDVDGVLAQGDLAQFDLGVAMRDAAAGALPSGTCEPGATVVPLTSSPQASASHSNPAGSKRGVMAYTGGELPVPLIVLAASLIGAGVALLGRRRRDDRDADARR